MWQWYPHGPCSLHEWPHQTHGPHGRLCSTPHGCFVGLLIALGSGQSPARLRASRWADPVDPVVVRLTVRFVVTGGS
jgi:hypothetical protein